MNTNYSAAAVDRSMANLLLREEPEDEEEEEEDERKDEEEDENDEDGDGYSVNAVVLSRSAQRMLQDSESFVGVGHPNHVR